MSYEDVKKYAVEYFESQNGVNVRTEIVTKADVVYDAIIVSKGTVGVCLNVKAIYDVYNSNVDMELYFKSILQELEDAVTTKFCTVVSGIQDWEKCKDLIRCRVINYEHNIGYLEDKVYKRFLDLAVVYVIAWANKDEYYSIVVNKSILESWSISMEVLDVVANQNMLEDDYLCLDIDDILQESNTDKSLLSAIGVRNMMYVLTNVHKMFGAALVFTPGVLRECADKLGGTNLIVIPSSKHEVLLLKDKMDAEIVRRMVCEVNATQVSSEDYLADNVYLYKYEEDVLVVC